MRGEGMEKLITLHIKRLPEGFYLATSDDIPVFVNKEDGKIGEFWGWRK